jgi:hypothetical protein
VGANTLLEVFLYGAHDLLVALQFFPALRCVEAYGLLHAVFSAQLKQVSWVPVFT